MYLKNIFDNRNGHKELVETIFSGEGFVFNRMILNGEPASDGAWISSMFDEMIVVVKGYAEIMYDDMSVDALSEGNYITVTAGKRYRFVVVSEESPCVILSLRKM